MPVFKLTNNSSDLTLANSNRLFYLAEGDLFLGLTDVAVAFTGGSYNVFRVNGMINGGFSFGVTFDLASTGNALHVGRSGEIEGATIGVGIYSVGSDLVNRGKISTADNFGKAVQLGSANISLDNHGTIRAVGSNGIGLELTSASNADITNSGKIIGGMIGVSIIGSSHDHLVNDGLIRGTTGVYVSLGTGARVENDGRIIGTYNGIVINSADSVLENAGLIKGASAGVAIGGGFGTQTVFNTGKIKGDVDLGSGDDTFENHGKGVAIGTVLGGAGDDFMVGAAGKEVFQGGDDDDEMYGLGGDDFLYGDAGFDTISGGRGGDNLFGGTGNDVLAGGGGNDALLGEDGDDLLQGQSGNDSLKGGAGVDDLEGAAAMTFCGAARTTTSSMAATVTTGCLAMTMTTISSVALAMTA